MPGACPHGTRRAEGFLTCWPFALSLDTVSHGLNQSWRWCHLHGHSLPSEMFVFNQIVFTTHQCLTTYLLELSLTIMHLHRPYALLSLSLFFFPLCCHCFNRSVMSWLFWDPMDCSLPGSSVHGIFQARILEWVAISFSSFPLLTQSLLTYKFPELPSILRWT